MEIRSLGRRKPRLARLFGAGGNLGHGQRLEDGLEGVEQIELLAARGVFIRANDHLFGAAAGRNQADAGFHQADVRFGRGMNARAMQANLAAAAERQSLRSDHDGRGACLMARLAFWKRRTAS